MTNEKRVEDAMIFGYLPGNQDSHEGVLAREVRRLREDLDRARKALTDIVTPMPGEAVEGYALRVNLTAHKALAAPAAPKEAK